MLENTDLLSESITNDLLSQIENFTKCFKQDNIITWNEADKSTKSDNHVPILRNINLLDTKIIQIVYMIMLHLSQCNEAAIIHLQQITDILSQRQLTTCSKTEFVRAECCPRFSIV